MAANSRMASAVQILCYMAYVDQAGTNSAGTNSAGTNSAGTNSAGTNSAGTNSAGTNSAGTNSAGTNSDSIGRSLRTNPVVVRRLLKGMERVGLVEIRPGKDGGVRLACAPADITLDRIHRAVEPATGVFALRGPGNPRCPVNRAMSGLLAPIFDAASDAVQATLRQTTLASLVRTIA